MLYPLDCETCHDEDDTSYMTFLMTTACPFSHYTLGQVSEIVYLYILIMDRPLGSWTRYEPSSFLYIFFSIFFVKTA